MSTIKFEKPYLITPMIRGYEIIFPYTITIETDGFLKDEISKNEIKIGISEVLLISWGYKLWITHLSDEEIIKLVFPFAIQLIKDKHIDGTLRNFDEIILTTENTKEYPFEISKIEAIEEYTFTLDKTVTDVYKNIETNYLADEIITLRDNINAIMSLKFKIRFINLAQERYILDFFRPVNKTEEFTHRISSIGNLIGDYNVEFLREITQISDTTKQSIDLLESFYNQFIIEQDKRNKIIMNLRKIRKVRQAYPIHTDNAKGVIDSMNYFGIDYPIIDYEKAWKRLLESYRDTLKLMLIVSKEITPPNTR